MFGAALGTLLDAPPAAAAPPADAAAPVGAARPAWQADPVTTPRVGGLHVQFGADPSREVVVSCSALSPVQEAKVLVGGPDGVFLRSATATTRSYTDGKSGQVVHVQHARITGLRPGEDHRYVAQHAGAEPEVGSLHPDRGQALHPAGRRHSRQPATGQRQPGVAGRR